jgi:hypothetical protein
LLLVVNWRKISITLIDPHAPPRSPRPLPTLTRPPPCPRPRLPPRFRPFPLSHGGRPGEGVDNFSRRILPRQERAGDGIRRRQNAPSPLRHSLTQALKPEGTTRVLASLCDWGLEESTWNPTSRKERAKMGHQVRHVPAGSILRAVSSVASLAIVAHRPACVIGLYLRSLSRWPLLARESP